MGGRRGVALWLLLAVSIALVILASLGVLGVVVVSSTRSDALAVTKRQLERAVAERVAAVPPAVEDRPAVDPRGVSTAHLVVDPDGRISVAEPAGFPSEPLPLPILDASAIERLRSGDAVTLPSRGGPRYLALAAATSRGKLEVEAAPLDLVDDAAKALVRRFAAGAAITLAVAIVVVVAIVRRGLSPLDDVVATADAVAAGSRDQRIPSTRGPTEVRRLSAALDQMLTRQQDAVARAELGEARLRAFVADASHELQTPITSVLGWTELQRKGALDAASTEAALAKVDAEGRRMANLVDELAELAELDEGRPPQVVPVDVAMVAGDAVAAARVIDPDRPLRLVVPDSPLLVSGDPRRLRQVVDNLLRNVRVHTPPGTEADVVVTRRGAQVVLTVADRGPGIAPEHLERVFDRFWRADRSRSRSTGGNGLGLAIVAGIVGAHGGEVRAANAPGGGAVLTVELPAAAGAS